MTRHLAISKTSMSAAPPIQSSPNFDRITRRLLIAVGAYSVLLVGLLNLFILNSGDVNHRAVIGMADGMIFLWLIVGGSLTPVLQRRFVPRLAAIPIDWRMRFVVL